MAGERTEIAWSNAMLGNITVEYDHGYIQLECGCGGNSCHSIDLDADAMARLDRWRTELDIEISTPAPVQEAGGPQSTDDKETVTK